MPKTIPPKFAALWAPFCVFAASAGAFSSGARAEIKTSSSSSARPNILFCILDDASWIHNSVYGAKGGGALSTPHLEALAREGLVFQNAFTSAPTCSPARAAILAGRPAHTLGAGANLMGGLAPGFALYTDVLEREGYHVGRERKGWAPGDWARMGRNENPSGREWRDFSEFLEARSDKPFCFWFGTTDPHRPYERNATLPFAGGLTPQKLPLPAFLPDAPAVREDFFDYALELRRFDSELGGLLRELQARGLEKNTLVVVTSDNGMPFPRAKAQLYDYGTRVPLVARWPAQIRAGRRVQDVVSTDRLGPTFLEAAEVARPASMRSRSLLGVLRARNRRGWSDASNQNVVISRERHDLRIREVGGAPWGGGYPMRALRTARWLLIRNFAPDRAPAFSSHPTGRSADADRGPTVTFLDENRNAPAIRPLWEAAFGPRPAEELYDAQNDPENRRNLASDPKRARLLANLRRQLMRQLESDGDPQARGDTLFFDRQEALPPNPVPHLAEAKSR